MYFFKRITGDVKSYQLAFKRLPKTKRLVIGALIASIAALFQSAGGFLPGLGYFISPFATAPILFCSMLSIPLGSLSYLLTNLLLFILQPSELIVFPFTTGLLGLGTGAAFWIFHKRISIMLSGSILLTIGILILLYVFQFPVLGPTVSNTFSIYTIGYIFFFALFYNWIWIEFGVLFLKKIKNIIVS